MQGFLPHQPDQHAAQELLSVRLALCRPAHTYGVLLALHALSERRRAHVQIERSLGRHFLLCLLALLLSRSGARGVTALLSCPEPASPPFGSLRTAHGAPRTAHGLPARKDRPEQQMSLK
jgi:hypothetical protein